MTIKVPAGWPQVLRALLDGPTLWLSPEEIAEVLALDLPPTRRRLRAMVDAEWVCEHREQPGMWYTLGGKSIEAMGLEPTGEGESFRWRRPEVEPTQCRSTHRALGEWVGELVDPSPDPSIIAEWLDEDAHLEAAIAEAARRSRWIDIDNVPYPTVILEHHRGKPRCGVCGKEQLPRSHYCLACDNWGWDGYFAEKLARTRADNKRRVA